MNQDSIFNLLIVDDDQFLSSMIAEYLEEKGFAITLKHNAEDGLTSFKSKDYDLCIFDVMMPFRDGFSLATEIRTLDEDIPIIFLTGQNKKQDRIKGLTIGADDYITKPFSMEELYLRIKAILKRMRVSKKSDSGPIKIGRYTFDTKARELTDADKVIKLSAIESGLLEMFCENRNGLLQRDLALNRIWQDEDLVKGKSLSVYVSKLRNYLKADSNIAFLNVHGEGYRMVVKE